MNNDFGKIIITRSKFATCSAGVNSFTFPEFIAPEGYTFLDVFTTTSIATSVVTVSVFDSLSGKFWYNNSGTEVNTNFVAIYVLTKAVIKQ